MHKFQYSLTASALALVFSTGIANAAVDTDKFLSALKAHMEINGIVLNVSSADADGEDVILREVKAAPYEVDAEDLGDIRLQDVTETDTGSYTIGRIEVPQFSFTKDGVSLDFGGAAIDTIPVPSESETDPIRKLLLFNTATVQTIKLSDDEGEFFKMQSASMDSSPYAPGSTMEFSMNIIGVSGDLASLPEDEARETMAALGYDTLTGDMRYVGTWNTGDGHIVLDQFSLDVDDAAVLKMRLDMSGYTPEMVSALQDLQKKQMNGGMSDEAAGMAMLGMMQQFVFNGAEIRLEDASLTGRILDYVAAQQGASRDQVTNMAKGMLPFALAQLQNPAFAAMVTKAANAYLDDPKSLTIVAAPENPVPATQLMATGMSAPQTIPDVLGVTVTAND